MLNKITQGDTIEKMKLIDDGSVDMILADLPYGTTDCTWDSVVPLDELWKQYNRIIKEKGAIVLTASQPFTTTIIASNIESYRYNWVWNKRATGNPFLAKYQPLKIHEDIVVFSKEPHDYYPQMVAGKLRYKGGDYGKDSEIYATRGTRSKNDQYYPKSIIDFTNAVQSEKVHPTQKPVELFEYLIKTYTNDGDTVLDNVIGSGTTAIAALNTNRNFIGIEKEQKYVDIANERIANSQIKLFI